MNYVLKIQIVLLIVPAFCGLHGADTPKAPYTVSHFYEKEVINGITFIYEEEVLNGKYKGVWLVDDRAVSVEAFQEKMAQAKKEECLKQRRQAFASRMDDYKKKHESEIQILKKLIQLSLNNIEQWLQKISEQRLEQYLVYSEKTFSCAEQFVAIPRQLIDEADQMLKASFTDTEVVKLKTLLEKLDDTAERLRILVYESLDGAIKQCDDPCMLKKLLAMVENI